MDFDGDGIDDILSGSYMPGELYLFRGAGDGGYETGMVLKDDAGRPLVAGTGATDGRTDVESLASVPFAHDWDDDGDLDLLVGNIVGQVVLIENLGSRERPSFSRERVKLEAGGAEIKVPQGDSGPVVVDWDADGRPDLVVGSGDGSVLLYRNVGTRSRPAYAAGRTLVASAVSPEGAMASIAYGELPKRPGLRTKVCVTDYDRDGRLDLLVGDFASVARPEPELTEAQRIRRDELRQQREELQSQMQTIFEEVRAEHGDDFSGYDFTSNERFVQLQERMTKLHGELSPLEAGQDFHGWVWAYVRR